MGGHPPIGPGLAGYGFYGLVLAAHEFQPPGEAFPDVVVLHAPMHDDDKGIPEKEVEIALHAAHQVAKWLRDDKKTLVTCWKGHNRSGLISALALLQTTKLSPDEVITLIRAARGPAALSNPHFVRLIYALFAKGH
jgi:protein-tyrosine phosphatase